MENQITFKINAKVKVKENSEIFKKSHWYDLLNN